MAVVIAYTPQVLGIVAQDFARGQVGPSTVQFVESLIRAIQELQAEMAALEARVTALEGP